MYNFNHVVVVLFLFFYALSLSLSLLLKKYLKTLFVQCLFNCKLATIWNPKYKYLHHANEAFSFTLFYCVQYLQALKILCGINLWYLWCWCCRASVDVTSCPKREEDNCYCRWIACDKNNFLIRSISFIFQSPTSSFSLLFFWSVHVERLSNVIRVG